MCLPSVGPMLGWRTLALSAVLSAAGVSALLVAGVTGLPAAPSPANLPDCAVDDLVAAHAGYDDWARTLLDPAHTVGPDYKPPDLRSLLIRAQPVTLRSFVLTPLTAMLDAAAADGVSVHISSAYRSYADQLELVEANPGKEDLIARPGHSEHQLGTAVDLAGRAEWLAANAPRFGFVLSFPPARSPEWTCYSPEPWHFRYVGPAEAQAIEQSGLSPREWLWAHTGGG